MLIRWKHLINALQFKLKEINKLNLKKQNIKFQGLIEKKQQNLKIKLLIFIINIKLIIEMHKV